MKLNKLLITLLLTVASASVFANEDEISASIFEDSENPEFAVLSQEEMESTKGAYSYFGIMNAQQAQNTLRTLGDMNKAAYYEHLKSLLKDGRLASAGDVTAGIIGSQIPKPYKDKVDALNSIMDSF